MSNDRLQASSFEAYMLDDQTVSHPMTYQIRLGFQGEADPGLLRQALERVAPLHPLLSARPFRQQGRWVWDLQHRPLALDVDRLGQPLMCPGGVAIDLPLEPSVRLWCRTGQGRTELSVQGHHATTDAMGIFQFLFDVLAAYHQQWSGAEAHDAYAADGSTGHGRRRQSRVIDPALLPHRDRLDFSPPKPVRLSTQVRGLVSESAKLLLRRPQPLSTANGSSSKTDSRPAQLLPPLHAVELSADTSEAFRQAARSQGVMANDLFLRDAFVTLVRWFDQCGPPLSGRRWLRLTMPINVRNKQQTRMSAANVISYAFLTRRVEMVRDPARLLASIHEEIETIKYWRLASMFLGGITAIQRARMMRPVLRLPVCFSSLVVSNLGDIRHCATAKFPRRDGRLVAGNLELQSVAAAPPPRARTHAAVAVSRYAGRFTLGIQTDNAIDEDSARAFLQLFAEQIRASAQAV